MKTYFLIVVFHAEFKYQVSFFLARTVFLKRVIQHSPYHIMTVHYIIYKSYAQ